jgi:predicted DNA-binding protein (MmcQ/YjbR family)
MALTLPFASPTGYGLGRAGWVTARFAAGDDLPIDLVKEWIAQSYRAVAPRAVLKAHAALPARRPGRSRR